MDDNKGMFETLRGGIIGKGFGRMSGRISGFTPPVEFTEVELNDSLTKGEISAFYEEADIEKAGKDKSKLVAKRITDSIGRSRTVYVLPGHPGGDTHEDAWKRHEHNVKVQRMGVERSFGHIRTRFGEEAEKHVRAKHEGGSGQGHDGDGERDDIKKPGRFEHGKKYYHWEYVGHLVYDKNKDSFHHVVPGVDKDISNREVGLSDKDRSEVMDTREEAEIVRKKGRKEYLDKEKKEKAKKEKEAHNIGGGIEEEEEKAKKHGIKAGDKVKDISGVVHDVKEVRGNILATGNGRLLHAYKVSHIGEEKANPVAISRPSDALKSTKDSLVTDLKGKLYSREDVISSITAKHGKMSKHEAEMHADEVLSKLEGKPETTEPKQQPSPVEGSQSDPAPTSTSHSFKVGQSVDLSGAKHTVTKVMGNAVSTVDDKGKSHMMTVHKLGGGSSQDKSPSGVTPKTETKDIDDLTQKYSGKNPVEKFMSRYGTNIEVFGKEGSGSEAKYHVKYGASSTIIPHTEEEMISAGYKSIKRASNNGKQK